jgi:hypothetical protein
MSKRRKFKLYVCPICNHAKTKPAGKKVRINELGNITLPAWPGTCKRDGHYAAREVVKVKEVK